LGQRSLQINLVGGLYLEGAGKEKGWKIRLERVGGKGRKRRL